MSESENAPESVPEHGASSSKILSEVERQRIISAWSATIQTPEQLTTGNPTFTYRPDPVRARVGHVKRPAVEKHRIERRPHHVAEEGTKPGDLGGYVFLEKIGEGGMGIIYRAEQSALLREVAVKQVKGDCRGPAEEQFLAEALITGQLEHPNIVPVHTLGQDDEGRLFMAMKLVQGVPWSRILHPRSQEEKDRAARTDLEAHLRYLIAVSNAVAFAHNHGIIHRDLKPQNVMLGDYGEVLVMDWGLSVEITDPPSQPPRAPHRSTSSDAAGTPAYMAPEMVMGDGQKLDRQTDVFLLGAILHEVLTGKPPNHGENMFGVLACAALRPEPVLPKDVPLELADICRRALAKEPGDRHPTVVALRDELEAFLKHRESLDLSQRASDLEKEARHWRVGGTPPQVVYSSLSKSIGLYEQAIESWPENRQAQSGRARARRHLTEFALFTGDLGFAEANIGETEDDCLHRDLARLKKQRARRIFVTVALGLSTFSGVVLAVAALIIGARTLRSRMEQNFVRDGCSIALVSADTLGRDIMISFRSPDMGNGDSVRFRQLKEYDGFLRTAKELGGRTGVERLVVMASASIKGGEENPRGTVLDTHENPMDSFSAPKGKDSIELPSDLAETGVAAWWGRLQVNRESKVVLFVRAPIERGEEGRMCSALMLTLAKRDIEYDIRSLLLEAGGRIFIIPIGLILILDGLWLLWWLQRRLRRP